MENKEKTDVLSFLIIIVIATVFAITAMVLYPEMYHRIFRILFIVFVLIALLSDRFKKNQGELPNESIRDCSNDDELEEFDNLGTMEFWWE